MLNVGILNGPADKRVKILGNYFAAWEAELKDKELVAKPAFFGAACDVLDELVRASLAASGSAKVPELREVVRPIAGLNYANPSGRGLMPRKEIAQLMQVVLRERVELDASAL